MFCLATQLIVYKVAGEYDAGKMGGDEVSSAIHEESTKEVLFRFHVRTNKHNEAYYF